MKVNVNQVIDNAKVNKFTIIVAILCCLCSIIEGYEMIVLGMITVNMAQDWGLKPEDFKLAHLAVIIGILLGSIIAGLMTDKIGRRKTLLIMFGIAGAGMGVSIMVQTMEQLIVLRIITGFGAGGSLPIAIALAAEYAPVKYRSFFVTLVFAGAPFASTVGGFVGPFFLDAYGWQGMFILGFIMAAPLWILMLFVLPESVKYLVSSNSDDQSKALKLLAKVDRNLPLTDQSQLVSEEQTLQKSPVKELFAAGRGSITLLLWLAFIGGQLIIYLMSLWMPTVLQQNGWEQTQSLNAIGQYYLGGTFGALIIGFLQDRFGASKVLMVAFPIGAALFYMLGQVVDNQSLWFTLAPFVGAVAVGAVLGKAALAASLYPTAIRGTGVGAAMGMGRWGGIITPIAGAALVAAGISATGFFNLVALAPLLCALAIFGIFFIMRRNSQ